MAFISRLIFFGINTTDILFQINTNNFTFIIFIRIYIVTIIIMPFPKKEKFRISNLYFL